jgi:hypothetical protein
MRKSKGYKIIVVLTMVIICNEYLLSKNLIDSLQLNNSNGLKTSSFYNIGDLIDKSLKKRQFLESETSVDPLSSC